MSQEIQIKEDIINNWERVPFGVIDREKPVRSPEAVLIAREEMEAILGEEDDEIGDNVETYIH